MFVLVSLVSVRAYAEDARWSPAVKGLRGRLIAEASERNGKPQVRLSLELENVSDGIEPIAFWWGYLGDMLVLGLEDESGKPAPQDHPGGNHIDRPPYALLIPMQSSIRVTFADGAYEYLPSGQVLLRPFAFVAWNFDKTQVGKRYLRATIAPIVPRGKQPKLWSGTLMLPRVQLPVFPS